MDFVLGVAVGFVGTITLTIIVFVFAAFKTKASGGDVAEEDKEQGIYLAMKRQQEVRKRRAKIHIVTQ